MNYKKLYEHDEQNYFLKICEELSELQAAILHYRDNKIEYESVIEEIADVVIQIDKTMHWLAGFDDETYDLVYEHIGEIQKEKLSNLDAIINNF